MVGAGWAAVVTAVGLEEGATGAEVRVGVKVVEAVVSEEVTAAVEKEEETEVQGETGMVIPRLMSFVP